MSADDKDNKPDMDMSKSVHMCPNEDSLTAERDYWKDQHDKLMKAYERLRRQYDKLYNESKRLKIERDQFEDLYLKEY